MRIWAPGILAICLAATAAAAPPTTPIYSLNDRIPLGIVTFRIPPKGTRFYVLASAEDSSFNGLYRAEGRDGRPALFRADQTQVRFYPRRLEFRVTASSREKILDDYPFAIKEKLDTDDLFTRLHFRLKVFHGVEYRYIPPSFVELVGLPNDVRYNERIYRMGFELAKVPIEDRIVIEVLSPNGDRLCKFHLDLL